MDAPTVEGLCAEFMRIASWYTAGWCHRYPHLADEFRSAAGYALFTSARDYVAKGEELWNRMRFAVWLKIAVYRDCEAVVAKETRRRSRVGAQMRPGVEEADEMAGREAPADETLGNDEARYAAIERLVELLEHVGHTVTPEDLELVLRHHIDGVTVADLAREQGRPHSTVQTRVTRAVAWLRFAAGTGETPRR